MPTKTACRIVAETLAVAPAVEALLDRAFGPGRFVKTSERLREGNRPLSDLCLTAQDGGAVVGVVRLWPVRIGRQAFTFLGPLAVDPSRRGEGLAKSLVDAACKAAEAAGWDGVLLVGDIGLFGKSGFTVAPAAVRLPGPVDPRRLLARRFDGQDVAGLCGAVRADPSLAA
jgi:predicted N-acetyltransferase YhbS